jgi:hypothetical protein
MSRSVAGSLVQTALDSEGELKMNGAIEYLIKHPDLLEELPKEMLEQLMELVKIEKAKAAGWMPQSAVTAMTDKVDDKLMRDIVHDLRKLPERSGFLPADGAAPMQQRKSYIARPELEPPPGVKHIDRIAESFAELDKVEAQRRWRRL